MSFGEEKMFVFVENKSLHLPLTGGGTEGLPGLTDLDGLEVKLLGTGGSRTTGAGEDSGFEMTRAGEDGGGGDVAYSSSEQEKSSCSSSNSPSSEQSPSRDPSKGFIRCSTKDKAFTLAQLASRDPSKDGFLCSTEDPSKGEFEIGETLRDGDGAFDARTKSLIKACGLRCDLWDLGFVFLWEFLLAITRKLNKSRQI